MMSAQLLGCGSFPGSACSSSCSHSATAIASQQHDTAPSSDVDKVQQWLSNMELRAATNVISNHFSGAADAAALSGKAGSILPPTSQHAAAQQQQHGQEQHATPGKSRFKRGLSITTAELAQLEHPCKMARRSVKWQQLPSPAFVLLGIPM
jgi:hypothetical protein